MCHFYRSLRDAMRCVHGASISQKGLLLLPDSGDFGASLVAQLVKNPPAMQETSVCLLGQEDLLEKEMGTHCSILAWRIPWTKEPSKLQSVGSQRVGN